MKRGGEEIDVARGKEIDAWKQHRRKSPVMLRFARRPNARLDSPPRPRGWRRDGAVKPGDISSVTVVLAIAKTLQRHAPTQLKRATQAPPSQGSGEERKERHGLGTRGAGETRGRNASPCKDNGANRDYRTEYPQFFGMKISVMDVIQDEPLERFMT